MPRTKTVVDPESESRKEAVEKNKDNAVNELHEGREESIGYYAMRLAMTRTIKEENDLKREWHNIGILNMAVTEVGGNSRRDFAEKFARAVIGAALNSHIIEKTSREMHALNHAAEEAKSGVMMNSYVDSNIAVKVAIVRMNGWIAVATFGESAIHPLTGHERCGLGIMHI